MRSAARWPRSLRSRSRASSRTRSLRPPLILFAGLVSGALAYTLQILAQRYTPPAEAALILSLESVFAALAGAIMLGERLTALGALGCALILVGAVAVEAAPALARKAAARA